MMKRTVQKMISVLMILCMALGMCTSAMAQSADFEALIPLMDLVAAASWYSPNAPESVPGAEDELSLSFVDAFFSVGQTVGAEVGVTEAMLNDTAAQAEMLGQIFAARIPELQAITLAETDGYIGFQPVLVNGGADGQSVQIIGEIYLAEKPMRQMTEADYTTINWIERAVFTFQNDASALNGFRLNGYSVGTDLSIEEAMQGYFEEIAVEYNSNLGFTVLYPSVFADELLIEDENGVSAQMPDGSASFFAKRAENSNGVSLTDYVTIVANGITGSVANVYEDMQYGTVAYTTQDGYAVFEVYIVTGSHIYQAQLNYLTSLMSEFGMYNAYLENSFVVNELSQG